MHLFCKSTYCTILVVLLFTLSVSCDKNEEKTSLDTSSSPEISFEGSDTLVVNFPDFKPNLRGYIKSDNDLKSVKFYILNGDNRSLAKEIKTFEDPNDFPFDQFINYNSYTTHLEVVATDVFDNQAVRKQILFDYDDFIFSAEPISNKKAFPGAEGHGQYTTGGRGGRVYKVTHLRDDGSKGSLRWAVEQEVTRTIVFDISGTIKLKSELKISNGNVTIAGQTAPGDGICLRDYSVSVNADNVIIRFIRFRLGDEAGHEGDALWGRSHKNIIVDHCSMSWSTDECVSFYQNEDFTLQWCIISESLRNSVHGKGSHGYGGIWGGKRASFHHNLLAHHDSRNPRLGEVNGSSFALTDLVDLRNNVIYNWLGNSCYGGEGMNVNIVNCYYKPGPATTKEERIVSIDMEREDGYATTGIWGSFYIHGNYMAGSTRATNDNWTYGVYNQFHHSYGEILEAEKNAMRLESPHDDAGVTTHSALDAYELVLDYAGASLARDAVDQRIVNDVETGTATYMTGGNGSINGIIDSQSHVGGWPELNAEEPLLDTDLDGMPDVWEKKNSLNPYNPLDGTEKILNPVFTNLEIYINSLVNDIMIN